MDACKSVEQTDKRTVKLFSNHNYFYKTYSVSSKLGFRRISAVVQGPSGAKLKEPLLKMGGRVGGSFFIRGEWSWNPNCLLTIAWPPGFLLFVSGKGGWAGLTISWKKKKNSQTHLRAPYRRGAGTRYSKVLIVVESQSDLASAKPLLTLYQALLTRTRGSKLARSFHLYPPRVSVTDISEELFGFPLLLPGALARITAPLY